MYIFARGKGFAAITHVCAHAVVYFFAFHPLAVTNYASQVIFPAVITYGYLSTSSLSV